MDGKQFDHVVRALQDNQPRRGVAGLLLGGALGLAGLVESAAKGGGKGGGGGKKGGKGGGGKGGGKGGGGKGGGKKDKKCDKGEQRCNDDCVKLQSDRNNCGSCGRICTEKEDCVNGGCFGCSDPLTKCGIDECFDLTSSNQHCGACNRPCAENEQCINSLCACAGPHCLQGNGERRCCPATNGICCPGGKCCPSGQFCTEFGGCCPTSTFACADGVSCCPIGQVCRNGLCFRR